MARALICPGRDLYSLVVSRLAFQERYRGAKWYRAIFPYVREASTVQRRVQRRQCSAIHGVGAHPALRYFSVRDAFLLCVVNGVHGVGSRLVVLVLRYREGHVVRVLHVFAISHGRLPIAWVRSSNAVYF